MSDNRSVVDPHQGLEALLFVRSNRLQNNVVQVQASGLRRGRVGRRYPPRQPVSRAESNCLLRRRILVRAASS